MIYSWFAIDDDVAVHLPSGNETILIHRLERAYTPQHRFSRKSNHLPSIHVGLATPRLLASSVVVFCVSSGQLESIARIGAPIGFRAHCVTYQDLNANHVFRNFWDAPQFVIDLTADAFLVGGIKLGSAALVVALGMLDHDEVVLDSRSTRLHDDG